MKLFKVSLPEIFSFFLLFIAFLTTRLYNIMSLPIFTDEAIYTRWAQIASQDASWRFISLTDGKQPSFVWVHMIFLRFINDPLLAGRLVSVFAGFFTVIGIYFLTREIFKKATNDTNLPRTTALIAMIILVFYPFSVVYDRMALYDSMVAMFFVWALYFQILLVRLLRLDIAMILGAILGGAVLTKSSGFLSIYMTPFLLLLRDFKDVKEKLPKFIALFSLAAFIAYAMYAILRLSPYFHIIDQKNSIFVYSIKDWLSFPTEIKISNFISNFNGLSSWFLTYFSALYIGLVAYSFTNFRFIKEKIILLLWFMLPFLALIIFGKTLYPRYVLFMTMPLIPLVALALYNISKKINRKWMVAILFVIALLPSLRSIYLITNDFAKAPIPQPDLGQYINDWPSGGGVKESVEFFEKEAQKGPIFIATEGTFGLMPYSYEIYLVNNKNITIKGFWPIESEVPKELVEINKKMPVYIVFYQPCPSCSGSGAAPLTWPLTKIATYQKGISGNFLTVYKLNPL